MEKIIRFLSDPAPAGRRNRSWAGLLLTLFILPVLLGVMACFVLPVPIGDPEKSRIDPALSGVWLSATDDEAVIFVFEPYDKRTWMVSYMGFDWEEDETEPADRGDGEADADADDGAEDDVTVEIFAEGEVETVSAFVDELLNEKTLTFEGFMPFKGWQTRIKRELFLTLEPKLVLWSEDGMTPNYWWPMHLRVVDMDHIILTYIDPEFDEFEEDMTSKDAERIIRRNLDNPDLYIEDGDVHYRRVPHESYDAIHDLLEEHGISSDFE